VAKLIAWRSAGKMHPPVAATYLHVAWSRCVTRTIEWILGNLIGDSGHDILEALYRCLEAFKKTWMNKILI